MTSAAPGETSSTPATGGTPTATDGELSLAGDFAAPERETWEQLVASVLRKSGALPEGSDVSQASHLLATTTLDGITIEPLYTRSERPASVGFPGVSPFVRGRTAGGHGMSGWDIRQRHDDPDPAVTREAVLTDLENGVTSLWLTLGAHGIAIEDLDPVLSDVLLDLVAIVLDAGSEFEDAAKAFFTVAQHRSVRPADLRGNLGADPLGVQARTGSPASMDAAVAWAQRCAHEYPGIRAITVDALAYHEAGGSDAQELGASIAAGVSYLRAMLGAGLSIETALAQLEFRYAASADQFLTIAKLRAGRRLWARVADVCGAPADSGGQRQHAVSSWAMMTRRDPWTNMLRATLACFGAGVGGADAVTVLPFDAAIGLPDAFARRIARNTQSVLIHESNLAQVIDPAGGSWYVESLTDDLAAAGWEWFQEIERAGGLAAALSSGFIAERLDKTSSIRTKRVATRKDAVVGVSEFPLLDETAVVRPAAPGTPSGGLRQQRFSQQYEQLRDRSDAHLLSSGSRPIVFLAGLGSTKEHAARTSFAAGAMSPGGIETVVATGQDMDSLAEAFAKSGASVVILCSSDAVYAGQAEVAARTFKERGATRLLVAGRPGEREAGFLAAGIDDFVYVGADLVTVLASVLDASGVR